MPAARIIASKPSAARDTAQALRQAGYTVEIVSPGTPSAGDFDLEFDADADRVISESTPEYVPGQREFFLKPLWRKVSANYYAKKDVARAEERMRTANVEPAALNEPARVAPAPVLTREEEQAEALRAEDARRHELVVARRVARERAEVHRIERERTEARRVEQARLEAQQTAELANARRIEQERVESQRAERERKFAAQQVEAQQREEARQQQELAQQREFEQQRLALQKQDDERRAAAEARRLEEAEAARQSQLAQQREDARQQEALRREAEEAHRQEVLQRRQEEEQARRAQAQSLLLAATKQREESIRQRVSATPVSHVVEKTSNGTAAVPTLFEYAQMRMALWKQKRVRTSKVERKVERIDRAGSWRQAWPITIGVAAAFLLGWGIAAYHGSAAIPATQTTPPILTQGQYAPYPVAKVPSKRAAARPARRRVRDTSIAEDEVVTRHYYPAKAATAQTTPHKKISDLN